MPLLRRQPQAGEAGRCLGATDRQALRDRHGPLRALLMPEEKEIFFLKRLISLCRWYSQAAAEKGIRRASGALASWWRGARPLLQPAMAPKALLKAAGWMGALVPEELLYLNPLAPN